MSLIENLWLTVVLFHYLNFASEVYIIVNMKYYPNKWGPVNQYKD